MYQKPQASTVPEVRSEKIFLVILGHFLPFTPPLAPNTPENQHFEKMKKAPRDIVLLDYVHHK